MQPKFNINRPKISDDEINKNKNFEQLVKQFKQQSIQKAKHDKSWWKSKKVRYSAVIAGVTVICTISYFALFNKSNSTKSDEKIITQNKETNVTEVKKEIEGTKKTKFINAPSQNLKINYTAYKITNSKGGEINHPTSSKIKIPKNSFVDKNGKDIVGDVTIEYREFHDIGDVILSGIPMEYDSANIKRNFETAGMFDIKGTQNGEPVFIKSGQSLEVDLASHTDEKKFNQYYLDTIKKTWEYLGNDILTDEQPVAKKKATTGGLATNPKVEKLKNEIDIIIPKKIDSVKIVYTKKVENLPKAVEPTKINKPSGKQTFQLDADKKEYPELAAFDNILFEIGDENKNYTKEMSDITWSDVKISEGPQKGKNYLLTLIYRSRKEKLIVYPVLTGKDLVKAQKLYQEKFAQYEGLVEKRKADEAKLMEELKAKQMAYLADIKRKQIEYEKEIKKMEIQMQQEQQNQLASQFNTIGNVTKARRIFQVSNFGIFNSDCPHAQPQGKSVEPIFVNGNTTIMPDLIYVIEHTNKTVVTLSYENNYKFNYDSKYQYSVIAFKNNKIYTCSKNEFKGTTNNNSNKFSVTEMENGVDNIGDFKKALEI
ncbi:MAG: hypothetical protein SFY56_02450 [Bacteroidota bacterium]|nr:hypothetical protein [Bacteroidota bacterium]